MLITYFKNLTENILLEVSIWKCQYKQKDMSNFWLDVNLILNEAGSTFFFPRFLNEIFCMNFY